MGNCLSDNPNKKSYQQNEPIREKYNCEKELENQVFDSINEFSFNRLTSEKIVLKFTEPVYT